ncbi:hypothetical protein ABPG74_015306 [Tetrahymena malaccensis]
MNQSYIYFNLEKKVIDKNQFNVAVNIFQGTILNGLYINYLAIDTATYNFIYISDLKTQLVNMVLQNSFYNYTFYVQFVKPQIPGNVKKVQAFLTGFKTEDQRNTKFQLNKFSIYFQITYQNSTGFNITVSQQDGSLKIIQIQYNFIEINEDPYGYFQTDFLNQNKFENTSQYPCYNDPDNNSTCEFGKDLNRSLSLSIPLNHQFNMQKYNLFTGLNSFTAFNKSQNTEYNDPRIQIGNYTANGQNISISYYVWYHTAVSSISSQGIAIFQKSCSDITEILNKDTCIKQTDSCGQGTYLDVQYKICKLCDISCFTCLNQASNCTQCNKDQYLFNNSCQNIQPPSYYCEKQSNLSYICSTKCQDTSCQTCSNQDSKSCTACQQLYYLFQNQCYAQKPEPAYCNNYICTQCKNPNCSDCSLISQDKCVKCQDNYYLFNGECYQFQPGGTFCDQDKSCQQCSNSLCLECQQNVDQCTRCQSNIYILGQDCYQQKPDQANCTGYVCTSSGQCQQQNQANQCLQCISGNYLYKNLCYNEQPLNTCCDSNKNCTDSDISNCQYCYSQSSTLKKCNQCQPGLYLYNNQCWKIQPGQTYCNSSLICRQCPSSLKNCLYCDDPSQTTQCLKCINPDQNNMNNCLSSQDQNIQCHFSCDKCFGNANNQCLSCASTTRQFDQLQNTCSCKQGFYEGYDSAQCWDDDLTPNQQLQQLGDNSIQLYLIFSLPFLMVNFHPFCDAYIYTLIDSKQLIFLHGFVSFSGINFSSNQIYYETQIGCSFQQLFLHVIIWKIIQFLVASRLISNINNFIHLYHSDYLVFYVLWLFFCSKEKLSYRNQQREFIYQQQFNCEQQHISQAFLVFFRNQKDNSHHFDMLYQLKNQPVSFNNNFFNSISDFCILQALQYTLSRLNLPNNQ